MESFIYLDHNIYNMMVRGHEHEVRLKYESEGLIPVYSDESINEIERSTRRRESFLELLERIDARHISVPLDVDFNHQGVLTIVGIPVRKRLLELADARAETEGIPNGLDFLTKAYGGFPDRSFGEILNTKLVEVHRNLSEQLHGNSESEFDSNEFLARARESLVKLEKTITSVDGTFAELDERASNGSVFEQFQSELGVKTIELNNIAPKDAVERIWDLVGSKFGGPDMNLVDFLDKIRSFSAGSPNTQPRSISLVNGVYNWLNMIGYHRDDGLDTPARMIASFGDMTHAGYAAACQKFLCNDKKMRLKVLATYNYLGVKCKIEEYQRPESNVDF